MHMQFLKLAGSDFDKRAHKTNSNASVVHIGMSRVGIFNDL